MEDDYKVFHFYIETLCYKHLIFNVVPNIDHLIITLCCLIAGKVKFLLWEVQHRMNMMRLALYKGLAQKVPFHFMTSRNFTYGTCYYSPVIKLEARNFSRSDLCFRVFFKNFTYILNSNSLISKQRCQVFTLPIKLMN